MGAGPTNDWSSFNGPAPTASEIAVGTKEGAPGAIRFVGGMPYYYKTTTATTYRNGVAVPGAGDWYYYDPTAGPRAAAAAAEAASAKSTADIQSRGNYDAEQAYGGQMATGAREVKRTLAARNMYSPEAFQAAMATLGKSLGAGKAAAIGKSGTDYETARAGMDANFANSLAALHGTTADISQNESLAAARRAEEAAYARSGMWGSLGRGLVKGGVGLYSAIAGLPAAQTGNSAYSSIGRSVVA